eukprot:scaffold6442_cov73-Skeletonema_marinoi.AAC.4
MSARSCVEDLLLGDDINARRLMVVLIRPGDGCSLLVAKRRLCFSHSVTWTMCMYYSNARSNPNSFLGWREEGALISAPTLDTLFDSSSLHYGYLTKWVGYNTSTFVKLLLEQRRVSSAKMPVQEFVRILTIRFSQTHALLFSSNAKVLYQATVSSKLQ